MHYTAYTLAFLTEVIGFPAILIALIIANLSDFGSTHRELALFSLLGVTLAYALFSCLCLAYMDDRTSLKIDYTKKTNIGICYLPFAVYPYKPPTIEEQVEAFRVNYTRFIAEEAAKSVDRTAQVGVDCRADYPMLICEAAAQSVHAADKDSYYRFIHEAAMDLLDIECDSSLIGCSAQVGDSSTLSAVQEEPVEAAVDLLDIECSSGLIDSSAQVGDSSSLSAVHEELVEAADDSDYSMFIGGAAADLLDIEGSSGPIDSSAQVDDSSSLSEVQEELAEAAADLLDIEGSSGPIDSSAQVDDSSSLGEIQEESVEATDDADYSMLIDAAAAEPVDASPDGTAAGAPTTNACARPPTMVLSLPSDGHGASAATLVDDAVPVPLVFAPFTPTMPTDAAKAVFSKALGVAGPTDGRKLSIARESRQPSPSRPLPLDSGIFYRGEQRCSKGNGTGDSESKSTRTSEIRVGDDVGGVAAEISSKSNAVDGAGSYELSGSRSIIGAASDGDNATIVSGFYGGTHDYSDSFSSFELGFSPADDALSFDCNDPFNGQDFVLVGDVDVLPTLSRIDSHLVKRPKAFIRMLIPVLQGCQEWRARSICSKSFEMELWTLEYCCKPTRGSEQIEKHNWLSFRSSEFASLDDALNRFIAPKVLGKLNLSTCGECGKVNLGGQTRVSALSALPPILTIQLVGSRGIFGTEKGTRRMRFAAELDMRPYIRHSHDRTQKTIYSLFLVVAHDGGSSRKGNYTSFARSSNNDWYRCRAGHYPDEVCEDVVLAASARMLVYTLV